MQERHFDNMEMMNENLAALLFNELARESEEPFAIMLSGGSTPMAAYAKLAEKKITPAQNAYVIFSDERMVPYESSESNYGNIKPMLNAVNIPQERIIRVDTSFGLYDAARNYHEKLERFFEQNGRVTLGLLGMGADGHTASLFSVDDVRRGDGLWALDIPKDRGPDRVSVTRDLLLKIEKLILLVGEKGKEEALEKLRRTPGSLAVGAALQGCSDVSLWVA